MKNVTLLKLRYVNIRNHLLKTFLLSNPKRIIVESLYVTKLEQGSLMFHQMENFLIKELRKFRMYDQRGLEL